MKEIGGVFLLGQNVLEEKSNREKLKTGHLSVTGTRKGHNS